MSDSKGKELPSKRQTGQEILAAFSLGSEPSFQSLTMGDLERILSSLPDVVWNGEVDPQGNFRYRYMSPSIEQLTGYPKENFLAGLEFWFTLILPEDVPLMTAGAEGILAAKEKHHDFEYRFRRQDGMICWIRDCTSVERQADGTLVIDGVISDINARKQMEEELRTAHSELDERVRTRTEDLAASEQLFRQLTESITEVFWLSSPDKSKMFYVSPAYEQIFQRSCGSLYKRPRSFVDAIHPEDVQRVKDALPNQIHNDFDVEYRIIRRDGSQRWVRSRAFPVLNAGGEVYRIAGLVQDITERHQAAETLKENEQLYRTLLDRHVDGVALIVKNKVIYVNPAMCEIIGYREEELLEKDPYQMIQPADLTRAVQQREELFAGGPESVNEYQYVRPDGAPRWLEVRSRAIQYLGQQALLTFIRDTTELRVQEDRSRFLAMIVRNSNDAIIGSSLDGQIISWNPAAERLFGYQAEEVIRREAIKILIPVEREHEVPETLGRIGRGESACNFITQRLHRSGRLLDVSLTVSSILDSNGNIVGASAIVRDITEQMKVEQAKKVSEAMCESLVSTAPDLILIMDLDGTIRYINRVSSGATVESIIGRNTVEFLHPDYHEVVLDTLRNVWESGEFVTIEVIGLGEDGSWRWYESRHGPLREGGKMMGVTVISSDITDRKLEEQKREAEERILRELLEQRERERKLIAHEVHDGFMQDIVGAQLILQALLHTSRTSENASLAGLETVDHALRKAVNEGRRLINELGPLILEHEGIVDALYNHIDLELTGGDLEVEFQANIDDSAYAPLFKGTIFRIVQEALTNVLRHSRATMVKVSLSGENLRLLLEVHDNGVGFWPERVPADRFGLQGIRQRSRLFGGHAVIESSPGNGTKVMVNLPIIEDRPIVK